MIFWTITITYFFSDSFTFFIIRILVSLSRFRIFWGIFSFPAFDFCLYFSLIHWFIDSLFIYWLFGRISFEISNSLKSLDSCSIVIVVVLNFERSQITRWIYFTFSFLSFVDSNLIDSTKNLVSRILHG